jgi:hypothetical protein
LPLTFSFSQTTYPKLINDSLVVITAQQLKQTNLIFLEHQYLKDVNVELKKQNKDFGTLVANYQKTDSVRTYQLRTYGEQAKLFNAKIQKQATEIDNLKQKNKTWKKWTLGGFTLSAVLLSILLIR